MTEERGMDGVLRIDTYEGADLPPGSNRLSPCLCPRYGSATPEYGAEKLRIAAREANQRSRGERL
ncbi:hypothetical protein EHS43_12975 [Streptomyces sp. RP5T]|nr:hypothetical protein EHS43_12975 [Streptomyces sp. RP5T]